MGGPTCDCQYRHPHRLRLVWCVDILPPTPRVAAANPAISFEPTIQLPEFGSPLHDGLRPVRAVAAIMLCAVFAFLTLYATQPLLPMLTTVFHASKAMVGLTVSASTLG